MGGDVFMNCQKCKQNLGMCVCLGEGGLFFIRFSKGSCGAPNPTPPKEMRGSNVDLCFFEVVHCV